MRDSRVFAHEASPESSAFSIVKLFNCPGTTVAGTGEIASVEASETFEKESFHQNAGILKVFSKDKGFVRQLAADAKITTDNVVGEIPPHHGEKFRSLLDALAEIASPMEDRPHFRCCISPRGDIGGAERTKQFQLASITRCRRLECFKQSETLGEMANGFSMCEPVSRSHSGLETKADSLLRGAGYSEMLRDHFWLCLEQVPKTCFDRFSNSEMELSPPRVAGGIVQGFFDENVFKSVNGCRRLTSRIKNAGRQKFG